MCSPFMQPLLDEATIDDADDTNLALLMQKALLPRPGSEACQQDFNCQSGEAVLDILTLR